MPERRLSTSDFCIVNAQVHISAVPNDEPGTFRTFCGLTCTQGESRAQRGWCPICDDEARRLSGQRHDLVIDR